ncbi:MAG TPA: calcium/proton exchanger [Terriglobia bacterium]|nr:calcium/proton exchanger [Terriglobia bacterium]
MKSVPQANPGHKTLEFLFGGWKVAIIPLLTLTVACQLLRVNPVVVFALAALAVVPLAGLIGQATEEVAGYAGAAAGGILNATLGNITELVFGVVAIWAGQTEIVKASITGSIVGNLLLVFGLAAFVGGLGKEKLFFSKFAAGANLSMLFLAVVALVMPALFQLSVFGSLVPSGALIDRLSLWTSAVLLLTYFASLIFAFRTHRNLFRVNRGKSPEVSKSTAVTALVAASALAAVVSDILVRQIDAATRSLGWTQLFVGLVVVATVGNATEHFAALTMARHDQMDLALTVATGSSIQIALFVAPFLVLISQFRSPALSLVFQPLEIAAVILSVGVVALVSLDGETHWFEGLQLVGVYLILAVFFYYLPPAHAY